MTKKKYTKAELLNSILNNRGHKNIIINPSPERINNIRSGRERIGSNTAVLIEETKY